MSPQKEINRSHKRDPLHHKDEGHQQPPIGKIGTASVTNLSGVKPEDTIHSLSYTLISMHLWHMGKYLRWNINSSNFKMYVKILRSRLSFYFWEKTFYINEVVVEKEVYLANHRLLSFHYPENSTRSLFMMEPLITTLISTGQHLLST